VRARQQHARPAINPIPFSSQIQRPQFPNSMDIRFSAIRRGDINEDVAGSIGWFGWVQPVQLKDWTGSN
jgi:hypothetical protein